MVRPFDLRDLALIRRLGERGVSLHTLSALAENFHPLRGAIKSMLVGGEFPTYVWKPENGAQAGFVQLRVLNGSPQAHILYLSPRCPGSDYQVTAGDGAADFLVHDSNCDIWLALLDEATAEAGARGIHHIIAELDEHSPEVLVLRRAGFVVYTRQDIWAVRGSDYKPRPALRYRFVQRSAADDWDIQLLYSNTVPRLVQLVEAVPSGSESETWVVRRDGELAAFVNIRRGSVASWMRFFIHPDAESEADDLVAAALEVAFAPEPELVYCCVRRYESWLPSALERSGLAICSSQAVMVRRTVQPITRSISEENVVLEGQRIPVSSPVARNFQRPKRKGNY
ncbi:MAG TPA: hypothetical protein VF434_02730 [Promineifilum sp.]